MLNIRSDNRQVIDQPTVYSIYIHVNISMYHLLVLVPLIPKYQKSSCNIRYLFMYYL